MGAREVIGCLGRRLKVEVSPAELHQATVFQAFGRGVLWGLTVGAVLAAGAACLILGTW